MSIIYQFSNRKKVLNPTESRMDYNLKKDVLLYLNTGYYYKLCKRIFTLIKLKGNITECTKICSILNDSQLGILYTIYGNIGTILYILQETRELPIKRIEYEVDQFKNKLSNIYKVPQYLDNEPEVFALIDRIASAKTNNKREELITELTKLSDILYTAMNAYTLKLMKNHDMYPIARKFLP